jgi:hypothetical protein
MIELHDDELVFTFPEVHASARLVVDFQRTLRIPDDGQEHYLPPGLGRFPMRHVDDFARSVPPAWVEHGGVMLPMYQAEALWIHFGGKGGHAFDFGDEGYPFAVRVATGKIDAVTGKPWADGLDRRPQNYLSVPRQPWLDGYCVKKGVIRQFVAMPLGAGYTAEEQVTGKAEHGGLQILVHPMKAEAYERLRKERDCTGMRRSGEVVCSMATPSIAMGLAPGGKMRQEIYKDPFTLDDWDLERSSRCFVHVTNSLVWQSITGAAPPNPPPTSAQYTKAGLPWFEYYADDAKALEGSPTLAGLKSVRDVGKTKGDVPLPENESVAHETVVRLRSKHGKDQVREWRE